MAASRKTPRGLTPKSASGALTHHSLAPRSGVRSPGRKTHRGDCTKRYARPSWVHQCLTGGKVPKKDEPLAISACLSWRCPGASPRPGTGPRGDPTRRGARNVAPPARGGSGARGLFFHETNRGVFLGVLPQPPHVISAERQLAGAVVDYEPKRRHGSTFTGREATGSGGLAHRAQAHYACGLNPPMATSGRAAKAMCAGGHRREKPVASSSPEHQVRPAEFACPSARRTLRAADPPEVHSRPTNGIPAPVQA